MNTTDEQMDHDHKKAALRNILLDNANKQKDYELKKQELKLQAIDIINKRWEPLHEIIRTCAVSFGAAAALIFTLIRLFGE